MQNAKSTGVHGPVPHWCLPVELLGNVAPKCRRLLYGALVHLLVLRPILQQGVAIWGVHRRLHVVLVCQNLLQFQFVVSTLQPTYGAIGMEK